MTIAMSGHSVPTQLRLRRRYSSSLLAVALLSIIASCSSGRITEPTPLATPLVPLPLGPSYKLSASADVVRDPPARLHYAVQVTNTSASQLNFDYGGCWSFFQLFKTSDLTQTPVFDAGAVGASCTLELTRVSIAAGASGTLSFYYPIATLTSFGVGSGHYFVAVRLAPNDSLRQVAAGQVDLQP